MTGKEAKEMFGRNVFVTYNLQIPVVLAYIVGLTESIILQRLYGWIITDSGKVFEGKRYIYHSYKSWKRQFPWWSLNTIIRAISSLEEQGILRSKQFNEENGDLTKWYTIDYARLNYVVFNSDKWNDKESNWALQFSALDIEEEPHDTSETHSFIKEESKNLNPQEKIKKVKHRIPSDLEPFVDYWKEKELPIPKNTTKSFKTTINNLRKLKSGTLYNEMSVSLNGDFEEYKDIEFTIADFQNSVDNFYTALINPLFEPLNKEYLGKQNLNSFILNPFARQKISASLFLHYLENPPKLNRPSAEDKFPELTTAIIETYKAELLGGADVEIPFFDTQKFIQAAILLEDFILRNKDKINPEFIKSPKRKAELLCHAIKEDVKNEFEIKPGFFCSAITWSRRLPGYLFKEGGIEKKAPPIVNLSEPVRKKHVDTKA